MMPSCYGISRGRPIFTKSRGTQCSPSNRLGSVSYRASPRGQQIFDIFPRYHRRAHREILSHIFGAKDIQCPLQGDANFSIPTGQLAQVHRSP